MPDEQVDGDAPLRVLLDILSVLLSRSILALPFELACANEVIFVLELRGVSRLV
jgi:hypothetical protein